MSTLTFSSQNLSPDCSKVEPGGNVPASSISPNVALARLQAFLRISPVDLVDSDAAIILAVRDIQLIIQNENGRLCAARMPKIMHAAVEQTPEEIIAFVTEGRPGLNLAPEEAETLLLPSVQPPKWRVWAGSPWTVAVLAVVAVIMAYFSFSSEIPAGVEMISDPVKIASLHGVYNGKYGETGTAGTTVLQLDDGRFQVFPVVGKNPAPDAVMDLSYRYGLSNEQVVVVVANGAVLVPGKDGSLKYNDSVYPRIISP